MFVVETGLWSYRCAWIRLIYESFATSLHPKQKLMFFLLAQRFPWTEWKAETRIYGKSFPTSRLRSGPKRSFPTTSKQHTVTWFQFASSLERLPRCRFDIHLEARPLARLDNIRHTSSRNTVELFSYSGDVIITISSCDSFGVLLFDIFLLMFAISFYWLLR